MNKITKEIIVLSALFLMSGCSKKPTAASDGTKWDADWILVGKSIGVENTNTELTMRDNKDALSASGLYYATWTIGDAESFENDDKKTVDIYDAQIYMIVKECSDTDAAEAETDSWLAKEKETYTIVSTAEETYADQNFTVITYQTSNQNNPYERGITAFTEYNNQAVSVEMSCRSTFTEDESVLLKNFLNGFHYA